MQDVNEVGVLNLGDGAKVVHDNLGQVVQGLRYGANGTTIVFQSPKSRLSSEYRTASSEMKEETRKNTSAMGLENNDIDIIVWNLAFASLSGCSKTCEPPDTGKIFQYLSVRFS